MRACVLALLCCGSAAADYNPIWFADRVLNADIIAVGKIETLDGVSYGLRVERAIAGSINGELIRVQRFRNWTCARRRRPYRKGERIIAILGRFNEGIAALGSACEGEVLLDKDGARIVHPPGPKTVPEADVIAAIRELRGGFELERLLRSKSVTTLQATVEKLYFGEEGTAADHTELFARLLTHDDAELRTATSRALVHMVGRKRAADLAKRTAKRAPAKARLAVAIARAYAEPKNAAAFDHLLAVLEQRDPDGEIEARGLQHLLYEVQPLGDDAAALYPRLARLLARELPRDIAHALLIAIRRWHDNRKPLPYEKMPAERKRWQARVSK